MNQVLNCLNTNTMKWLLVIVSIPLVYVALGYIQQYDSPESPIFALGIIFSLSMTLLYSCKIISSKHVLRSEGMSTNVLIFFISSFICLFLVPFISFESILSASSHFWFIFLISSTFYYLSKFFHLKAIDLGEISAVVLLHSITPIAIGTGGFLILRELPNKWGVFGMVIIMSAIYVLKMEKHHTNFFDPIKSLFTDKASLYMLVTIFLISVTANLDKVGSDLASAYEWVFLSNVFLMLISIPASYKQYKKGGLTIKHVRAIYFISLLAVFQLVFNMIALLHTLVVYVVTLKTSSIIFTIFIGGIFFKETNIKKKFILGLFVVTGVVIISFLG